MSRRMQLITVPEPAKRQHKKPCGDCPWARTAVPGWLGGFTPESWVAMAHGDGVIACHTKLKMQCVGSAIFRANVCKISRDNNVMRLPADRLRVFEGNTEFLNHHRKA